MKYKRKIKSFLASFLVFVFVFGAMPAITFANTKENLVQNSNFQTADMGMWRVTGIDGGAIGARRTGGGHNPFSGAGAPASAASFGGWHTAPVNYTIEQDINVTADGVFTYYMHLIGGDSHPLDAVIYAYVRVGDEQRGRADITLPGWNGGQHIKVEIPAVSVLAGETATIGVRVYIPNPGGGIWMDMGGFFFYMTESLAISPPEITTSSLPNGEVGIFYSAVLSATGVPAPSFTITQGSLPQGLTLNGAAISGTPETAGTSTFTIEARNTAGYTTKQFTINISGEVLPAQSTIWVERVQGLSPDFIMGADISSVLAIEKSIGAHLNEDGSLRSTNPGGVSQAAFRDFDGQPSDLFDELYSGGVNWVRARIWNDPRDTRPTVSGSPNPNYGLYFGGGNTDVDAAIEIGLRASAAGQRMLANFHYSDFWADPNRQYPPQAWEQFFNNQRESIRDIDGLANALYEFTFDAVYRILDAGVDLGMVQIGNETNNAIAGVDHGAGFATLPLFAAGSRAVRNAEREFKGYPLIPEGQTTLDDGFVPDILIAIHKTDPQVWSNYTVPAAALRNANIDFDVIGTSYYPFWDGNLQNLSDLLNHLSSTFDVDAAVFEIAWPFTTLDSDGSGNNWSGSDSNLAALPRIYPVSPQGQANAVRDVIDIVAQVKGGRGIGVFYWEPAWITISPHRVNENEQGQIIGVQSGTGGYNQPRWRDHGSGWSSGIANFYDSRASAAPVGSSWDNKAMFNHRGEPIASLNVWRYVHTGAYRADGANPVEKIMDGARVEVEAKPGLTPAIIIAEHIPQTLEVIFADNSRPKMSVQWNVQDIQDLIALQSAQGGMRSASIQGTVYADGQNHNVTNTLVISPRNLALNPSFETSDNWTITFNHDGSVLDDYNQNYARIGTDNPRTGSHAMRYFRNAPAQINFTFSQTFTNLPAGYYALNMWHRGDNHGGGIAVQHRHIFIEVNGAMYTAPIAMPDGMCGAILLSQALTAQVFV